ncbi:MAG: T9SS type A sorting domain-containing protein [Bacteroidales bacterium]|nr:T9SS type A sorting domain-containing protein [Bacteroidales bacterium]
MKKILCLLLLSIFALGLRAQHGDLPDDSTIPATDVAYWVGNGDRLAVVAVNWATPDTCLAWGVHFDSDSALVADLLHTIAIYDDRFSFSGFNGMIDSINFHEGNLHLQLTGNWWMYNINGSGAQWGYNTQRVGDGDFVKFGDESCGESDTNFNYAWTTPVMPVALPDQTTLEFDDSVGTVGCQAIYFDDPAIIGWATDCYITRGLKRISNESLGYADYGSDNDGVGPSSESTTDGVVSLGDAGTAVLTFDQPISNGEGYDFAVFENSLNSTFLEQAFVEVSSDGEHYYRFPSVSNTQANTQVTNGGAINPRKIHNLAGKYLVGWGTPFDLEELAGYSNLDINNITHVRIVDVVGCIDPQYGSIDKNGHIINDPYPTPWGSSGFDLSGVAIMNGWMPNSIEDETFANTLVAYPNPCHSILNINNLQPNTTIEVYNVFGQLMASEICHDSQIQLNVQSYPAGIYFVKAGGSCTKIIKK